MSSLFNQASLVVEPAVYETSKVYATKPFDGSGDLTFTRSNDTATRVNSAGLIEKVRTNTYLYSNTFTDAAWTNLRMNFTAAAAANPLTGTNDAFKARPSTDSGIHALRQTIVYGVLSIYAKKGENEKIGFRDDGDTGFYATFNLNTGVLIEKSASALASIEALSGGWYRIQFAVPTSSSKLAGIYFLDNAYTSGTPVSNVYAGNGTDGLFIYAAQAETGDIATDYIATTSAAVSVGPVANVPRLDYLGSSCPRLLLEPQRTNSLTYSEQIDNAGWSKLSGAGGSTPIVTANYGLAPDGTMSAERVQLTRTTTSFSYSEVKQNFGTSGTQYTVSVYLKSLSGTPTIAIANDGSTFNYLATLTNDWVRYTATFTASGTASAELILYQQVAATSLTADFLVWGFQAEAGAYATSYIPTLGASVTRGADAASKSSINALIGGTSGTIFFEIKTNKTLTSTNFKQFFYYTDASASQAYVYLNGSNYLVTNPSLGNFTGSLQFQADTTYKVAIAYATNDFKLYVNGVERGSSTSGTPINAVNLLSLGSYAGSAEFNEFVFSQYIHFPTRLSNSDLAALTA